MSEGGMTRLPLRFGASRARSVHGWHVLPGLMSRAHTTIGAWRTDLIMMSVAIFSSSFDIFANVMIGEYNVRICQLVLLPIVACSLFELFRRPLSSWPQGYYWLVMWCAIQFLLCFRSPSITNAIGYEAWLLFDALTIAGFTFFISSEQDFAIMMKVYLVSFAIMALVGLSQLVLYALGIDFFVTQRWGQRWARINGFCFEPSFYSTYMLIGFVLYAYLVEKSNALFASRRALLAGLVLITAAIVLSTSRMGILMVAVWFIFRLFTCLARGTLFGRKASRVVMTLILSAIVVACAYGLTRVSQDFWTILLQGLGVDGGSAHSASDRVDGLTRCLEVFSASPLLGYSLGGVDPVLAAYADGPYVAGDNGSAMSIVGEMLVANGVLGLVPVVVYLTTLVFCRGKLADSGCSAAIADAHKALVWALVFELAILCFNQNILRPYLWIHLGMIATSWSFSRKCQDKTANRRVLASVGRVD